MQSQTQHQAVHALFRLMAAQAGVTSMGVFSLEDGAATLLTGTPDLETKVTYRTSGREANDTAQVGERLVARVSGDAAVTFDPGLLGVRAGFAAAQRVTGGKGSAPLLLALFDEHERLLDPAMGAALLSGAELVSAILSVPGSPDEGAAERHPGTGNAPTLHRYASISREAAHRAVASVLRAKPQTRQSVILLVDLDRFRAVNEALGPAAGDATLEKTAVRLERRLQASDHLFRLDGDRFLLVVERPAADLRDLAAKILADIARPVIIAGQLLSLQASIGMVAGRAAEMTAVPALLSRADAALRQAKAYGGGRFVLYEPRLEAAILHRSQLELDLSNAAGAGQISLAYQPYIELASGEVSGVEALMRWHHPVRGLIPPKTFIPMAEATGMILPLGNWALRTACKQAAGWPPHLALSVNISALQFHQRSFVAQVDTALAEAELLPGQLELEITETVLMRDNPEIIAQLEALIDRGVRIALDDFGTGYSALAYLSRLPHHRIKLDRTFVQDLSNPATAELIRAIIALARTTGVSTTAEGVECAKLLANVRAMGFSHAQGYLTGMPSANPPALLGRSQASSAH